jgi:hypothetical protein
VPLKLFWIDECREHSSVAVLLERQVLHHGRLELRPSDFAYRATLQLQ